VQKNAIFSTDRAEKTNCSKKAKDRPFRWIEADIIVLTIVKISEYAKSEFPGWCREYHYNTEKCVF